MGVGAIIALSFASAGFFLMLLALGTCLFYRYAKPLPQRSTQVFNPRLREIRTVMGSLPLQHMPMESIMRTPPPRYTSQPSLTSHWNGAVEADDRPPPLYSSKNEVNEEAPVIEPPPAYRSRQSLHSPDTIRSNNATNLQQSVTSPELNTSFESTASEVIAPTRHHRRRRPIARSRRRELPMVHALRQTAIQHMTMTSRSRRVVSPDALSNRSENEQFFHVRPPRAIIRQNQRRQQQQEAANRNHDVTNAQYQLPGAPLPTNHAQTLPLATNPHRVRNDAVTSSVRLHPLDGRVWRQNEAVTRTFGDASVPQSDESSGQTSAQDACPDRDAHARAIETQADDNSEAIEHARSDSNDCNLVVSFNSRDNARSRSESADDDCVIV